MNLKNDLLVSKFAFKFNVYPATRWEQAVAFAAWAETWAGSKRAKVLLRKTAAKMMARHVSRGFHRWCEFTEVGGLCTSSIQL